MHAVRRRLVAITAAAVVVALAPLPAVGVSSSAPQAGAPARVADRPASPDLRPDPSVAVPPRLLTAGIGDRERARIMSVRDVGGRPEVGVVSVRGQDAARVAVRRLQADPALLSVGIDGRVRALSISNDPFRSAQWGLTTLAAEQTWARSTGAGVTVAVIDTGVDGTHPDLAGQVLSGLDLVAGSGGGWADGNGHGTHVAGIVAATAGNGVGIAGLSPGVDVLPIRVLDDEGAGYGSDVATAIVWAADQGADVINLSLGGPVDGGLQPVIDYALGKDVVVVAAVGNDGPTTNTVNYPAANTGVIGVGATTSTDAVASFSTRNNTVDLAAPGQQIASTMPSGSALADALSCPAAAYCYSSGTSMAAPFVAAAAAILRAASPEAPQSQVAAALAWTAVDLGPSGLDTSFGAGRIDPLAAVCLLTTCSTPTPPASSSPTPTASSSPTQTIAPEPALASLTVAGVPTRPVAFGAGVRARATLRVGGASRAGAPVLAVVRTSKGWSARVVTTDSQGVAQLSFVPKRRSWVSFRYAGDASSLAAETVRGVRVRTRLAVTSPGSTVTVGVKPARGQRLTLQRKRDGGWTKVRAGAARKTVRFVALEAGVYRVRIATGGGVVGTVSRRTRIG